MRNKLQINITTGHTKEEFISLLNRVLPLLREDLETLKVEQTGTEDLKDTLQPSRKYEAPHCSFRIK